MSLPSVTIDYFIGLASGMGATCGCGMKSVMTDYFFEMKRLYWAEL